METGITLKSLTVALYTFAQAVAKEVWFHGQQIFTRSLSKRFRWTWTVSRQNLCSEFAYEVLLKDSAMCVKCMSFIKKNDCSVFVTQLISFALLASTW